MDKFFKAKISKQGEQLMIFVPECYRDDFQHRDIVEVRRVTNERNQEEE